MFNIAVMVGVAISPFLEFDLPFYTCSGGGAHIVYRGMIPWEWDPNIYGPMIDDYIYINFTEDDYETLVEQYHFVPKTWTSSFTGTEYWGFYEEFGPRPGSEDPRELRRGYFGFDYERFWVASTKRFITGEFWGTCSYDEYPPSKYVVVWYPLPETCEPVRGNINFIIMIILAFGGIFMVVTAFDLVGGRIWW